MSNRRGQTSYLEITLLAFWVQPQTKGIGSCPTAQGGELAIILAARSGEIALVRWQCNSVNAKTKACFPIMVSFGGLVRYVRNVVWNGGHNFQLARKAELFLSAT